MEIDWKKPMSIDEMREIVEDWIIERPTLKHTRESLNNMLYAEVDELIKALTDGEPKAHVNLEMGDIFFSILALETKTQDRHQREILSISGYCKENNLTIKGLFKKTWEKNTINYPYVFFNQMSPFINPKDAILCLRVLRKSYKGNPNKLNEFWVDTEHAVFDNQPFFDGYVAIGNLRGAIKEKLEQISKEGGETKKMKITADAKRLLEIGEWSMEPLKIDNNQYNWSLW